MEKKSVIKMALLSLFTGFLLCTGFIQISAAPVPHQNIRTDSSGENGEAPEQSTGEYSADFFFPSTQTLRGIISKAGMYINLKDYVDLRSAALQISYTCSDLILEDVSSLTFSLNGIDFSSKPVTSNGTLPTILEIDVPIELFMEGNNLLEISGYLRLSNQAGCEDEFNEANWVNISGETHLRITYDLIDDENYLSFYPYPFVSIQDETGEHLTVAVSDTADAKELESALFIMADLGSNFTSQNDVTLSKISDNEDSLIIYFGLKKNTPSEYLSLLPDISRQDQAVLKRIEYEGKEMLLVVSESGDALVEAARLLSDNDRILQITKDHYFVSVGDSDTFLARTETNQSSNEGLYTLGDIAEGGMKFIGPFHQERTIFLPVPADYSLSSQSKISLNMRYSENLDFDRSLVTVYWQDIPLGSKKLSKTDASNDTLIINAPADLVGTTGSSLKIAFELEVADLVCTPRQDQMPWAYITENSTIYLPPGGTRTLSLTNLPAPFQKEGRLDDLLVMISENPSPQELVLLGRTMSVIGEGSDGYGSLSVKRASEFVREDNTKNIVTVGKGLQNTFIQRVNQSLHVSYQMNFTAFSSRDDLVLAEDYAKQIGIVQLLSSPFNENRALLVLTSPSTEGLQNLIRLVSTEKLRWNLEKDTVIMNRGVNDYTFAAYRFIQPKSFLGLKPNFIEKVIENRESLTFTLISTGVTALLLLAAVLVLLRIRTRNRKEK